MKLPFENAESRINYILKTGIKCCVQHPNTTAAILTGTVFVAGLIERARREKLSAPHKASPRPS